MGACGSKATPIEMHTASTPAAAPAPAQPPISTESAGDGGAAGTGQASEPARPDEDTGADWGMLKPVPNTDSGDEDGDEAPHTARVQPTPFQLSN